MSLCKGPCEPLSTITKLQKEREAMPKDREVCYAEQRAGSSTLLRFARHPVGAGSCRLRLPVTAGGPGDRASHDFKASCFFMCSGTLSHAQQPKESRIKEDEKV